MKKFRKGQGTLEYVIILAAIVATIILVAGSLGPKIQKNYNTLADKVTNKVGNLNF